MAGRRRLSCSCCSRPLDRLECTTRCCFLGGSCSSASLLAPTMSCFEPVVVVAVEALMCRRLRSMTFLSPLVVLVLLMFVVAVVAFVVEPFLDFYFI